MKSLFQLTNVTIVKSDSGSESDQETVFSNDHSASTPQKPAISTPEKHSGAEKPDSNSASETLDRLNANIAKESSLTESSEMNSKHDVHETTLKSDEANSTKEDETVKDSSKEDRMPPRRAIPSLNKKGDPKNSEAKPSQGVVNNGQQAPQDPKTVTARDETLKFIQSEKCPTKPQGKSSQKIGRKILNFFRPKPKVLIKTTEVTKSLILQKIRDRL